MESPKRQRHNKGEDMISSLPDFIIGRILSFLPIKDAVRTSVLSKNWIYRWKFITDLCFEDRGCCSSRVRKKLFLSFIYRVLFHLRSSSIHSFSLTLSENYEPCHVDQWISAVLSRGVKKICVNSKNILALSSHSLMKYKSLEQLVLNRNCCCDIRVPAFACLSSLTVLHFHGVKFIGDTSNKSGNIHLDFPVLRKFETKNCTWSSSIKHVTLEVPLLEVVSIHESWCDDLSYPAIKFCASRLIKFTYEGSALPNNNLFDLSAEHVASADIVFSSYKCGEVGLLTMMALSSKILKQFKNVECLKFQKWKKVLLAKDSIADLPSFDMLSHLELGTVSGETLLALLLKAPYLKTLIVRKLLQHDQEQVMLAEDSLVDLTAFQMLAHLELEEVSGEILVALLLQAPYLKTLIVKTLLQHDQGHAMLAEVSLVDLPAFEMLDRLELGKVYGGILLALLLKAPYLKTLIVRELLQHDKELMNYDRVPECFLTTLQVVEFRYFGGSEHELNFAKFVMENAVPLKRMSFQRSSCLYDSKLEEVKEKLYSFKKCSRFLFGTLNFG